MDNVPAQKYNDFESRLHFMLLARPLTASQCLGKCPLERSGRWSRSSCDVEYLLLSTTWATLVCGPPDVCCLRVSAGRGCPRTLRYGPVNAWTANGLKSHVMSTCPQLRFLYPHAVSNTSMSTWWGRCLRLLAQRTSSLWWTGRPAGPRPSRCPTHQPPPAPPPSVLRGSVGLVFLIP